MNSYNKKVNKLYYGDNLEILKDKIESKTIDLIYLDPPFKSGKNYNIIFEPEKNEIRGATAQVKTFEDTWFWGQEAENEYRELIIGRLTKEKPNQKTIELIKTMRNYLGECSMMAYLTMMAPRLLEMRRVLKDNGSIYLHCDPTASHYLKLFLDAIFGVKNFRNEIIWHYRKWPSGYLQYQRNHDIVFFYSKSDVENRVFNIDYMDRTESTLKRFGESKIISGFNENGKRTPSQTSNEKSKGVPRDDVWDINRVPPIKQLFPTQKPPKLLERIINASSKEGDLILDPFCGCGTTIIAAEELHRKWIGIDITYLAIDVIKKRLELTPHVIFEIDGEPSDFYSAEKLAEKSPFQFQLWCISKINGIPSQTKSADKGVDGLIYYENLSRKDKIGKGIIQVKGTKVVNPSMIRELKGTIESQKADFGILIILQEPTRGMISEAIKESHAEYGVPKKIPQIQIISVHDLFEKKNYPILPAYQLPWHKALGLVKKSKPLFKEEENLGE